MSRYYTGRLPQAIGIVGESDFKIKARSPIQLAINSCQFALLTRPAVCHVFDFVLISIRFTADRSHSPALLLLPYIHVCIPFR